MPDVSLIDFTGRGSSDPELYAVNVLLFTKSTRLKMSPAGFLDMERDTDKAHKLSELKSMARTIPSSWEFVDLTFLISGVTRACAQQITRTRNASYAMQSQRIVDMSDAVVTNPLDGIPGTTFQDYSRIAREGYMDLISKGVSPQDARGLLPMNTQCNLVAKYNMRSFVDLVHSRSSLRTQDEYADIVRHMVTAARAVWPWIDIFLVDPHDAALEELEAAALELGVTPGSGVGWRIAKAIDLLRRA